MASDRIRRALDLDSLVDITTIGRKSGRPHRVEVGLRHIDGQIYLSNSPGKRDWAANLLANPQFTYHLKHSDPMDLEARATPVTDPAEKRARLQTILTKENHLDRLEERMAGSHLFRVDSTPPAASA
jgi:deazaflavin-dependent oxidoreductase (nitroreductase family)